MVTLPASASDEAILDVVRSWVAALIAGDFDEASRLLTATGNEREWPPALVQQVIESYDSPDMDGQARVTAPDAAREGPAPPIEPHWRVAHWNEPRGRRDVCGTVECDLPINGVWSDLTAIFWLRRVAGGLALELYDLHIL